MSRQWSPTDLAEVVPGDDLISRALRTVLQANRVLVRSSDEATLLTKTCEVIVNASDYVLAWIAYADPEPKELLHCVASAGKVGYLDGLEVTWSAEVESGRGPTGTAIRTGEPQRIGDTDTDARYAPWRTRGQSFGIGSTCALPLILPSGARGALSIYAKETDAFSDNAVAFFVELASNLSYGIEGLRRAEQQREGLKSTVESFALAVEARDPYTAGHQRRVALISQEICRLRGLSPELTEMTVLGAEVHDIGKIAVPAEILTTLTMTDLQYRLIQTHAEEGHDILNGISFLGAIPEIVLQHHERLDGSGYPNGLRGDEIHPCARIVAVADVFESMASDRPYRASVGVRSASAEIRSGAGRLYDADSVAACLDAQSAGLFGFLVDSAHRRHGRPRWDQHPS